jgi:hypothetical protein
VGWWGWWVVGGAERKEGRKGGREEEGRETFQLNKQGQLNKHLVKKFQHARPALSNRNTVQATYVILNFLVAT